jgi:hypothetical protein
MQHVGDEFAVWRVLLKPSTRPAPRAGVVLASVLGVPLKEAQDTLTLIPFHIPINFSKDEAIDLAERLRAVGLVVEPEPVTNPPTITCATHSKLSNDGQCKDCRQWICVVDRAAAMGASLCPDCYRTFYIRRVWRHGRTAVLLAVLVGVLVWAWKDRQRLEDRREWRVPLKVGVFVIQDGDVDSAAIAALPGRADEMMNILETEYRRYDGKISPFELRVLGPIPLPDVLPKLESDDFLERVEFTFQMWRFRRSVSRSLGEPTDDIDVSILLVTRPARGNQPRIFEGIAAKDGDFGVVQIELSQDNVDLAVITAVHEMLHTLGARDKYDPSTGEAEFPAGYYDSRIRYPQRYMEIMAHDIPLADGKSRLPSLVGEVRVGNSTAREIGWIR